MTQSSDRVRTSLDNKCDHQFGKLAKFYKDEIVIAAFNLSQSDLHSFLPDIEQVGCPLGPPADWEVAYQQTISDMSHANWAKAQDDLTAARIAINIVDACYKRKSHRSVKGSSTICSSKLFKRPAFCSFDIPLGSTTIIPLLKASASFLFE